MKHITAYSAFIALVFSTLLSGCMTPPSGNTHLTAGPLSVSTPTPIPELVQQILATAKNSQGTISTDIAFRIRDCRVSDTPASQEVTDPSAIADWGNTTVWLKANIPLENALQMLCEGAGLDFHISPYTSSGIPKIIVGPPELVADHPAIVRRAYNIPKKRAKMLAILPSRLSATGTCLAYDPQSGLLNVIDDEQDSTADDLLQAIGAKQIIRNPQIPEL